MLVINVSNPLYTHFGVKARYFLKLSLIFVFLFKMRHTCFDKKVKTFLSKTA